MTRVFFRRPPAALALLGAALLGGCSQSALMNEPDVRPCPEVAILADAATVTKFRDGPGRDLTDVLHQATFSGYTGSCDYDTDGTTGPGTLNVELRLDMTAGRGPANSTGKAVVPYFVSITDTDRNVLAKQTYQVEADFPGNRTQAKINDQPVYLTLPIAEGQTGAAYTVFVGFQLDRQQLDYNRKKRQ